jgi:pimeloyl-ACP methyl ester carboxylesterase
MCPPHLSAEVAEAIPDCDYLEIGYCGHLGYLERPAEVNSAIIEFLDKNRSDSAPGAVHRMCERS